MMIMGGRCREGGMARLTLETNKEKEERSGTRRRVRH